MRPRSPDRPPDAAARAARLATATVFFLDGVGVANWVVRIPAVQERLALGTAVLGGALLAMAVGALVAMPVAGRLVARLGSAPVTRAAAALFALTLALPGLAPSLPLLVAALLLTGAANGALGVAMNAQAVAVERQYERQTGRPIMSSFHALFSLGGLFGSATGGLVAAQGVAPGPHLTAVALVVLAAVLAVTPRMLPATADSVPNSAARARLTRPLLTLGVLAFCVLFGEGAMADWTSVYLRDVAGAGPGLAAAGYAAFSLAMAALRAVGDALSLRLGAERLVRLAGLLATAGLAIAILVPHAPIAIVGFGLVGAGFSVVFPTVLTGAGRLPGSAPGAGIAAVSSCGYAGFLAGPPIIGLVSEALGLRGGLAVALVTCALIPLLAGVLGGSRSAGRARSPHDATPPAPDPARAIA
jgi:predicted MFS family arabinose efflux permease